MSWSHSLPRDLDFCSRELLRGIDCECHEVSNTFEVDDLCKLHAVFAVLAGGIDIFRAFLTRLRLVNLGSTHVYICRRHRTGWVNNGQGRYLNCIEYDDECIARYAGCINKPGFKFPVYDRYSVYDRHWTGYGRCFQLKDLPAHCYDDNDNRIQCPELATYFPTSNFNCKYEDYRYF